MDRLIWTAWRAFWVGLGASVVLIAQSLMTAPASASLPAADLAGAAPSASSSGTTCPAPKLDPISRRPSTLKKTIARRSGAS